MTTPVKETLTLQGKIRLADFGETDDALFVIGDDTPIQPLAEYLEDKIWNKNVSVRYWITDKECTREEANESFLQKLFGKFEAEFCAVYSEYTGYLWTNESLKVGGHNLLSELIGSVGKYLLMEIDIHG